jgi:hypothetical protein
MDKFYLHLFHGRDDPDQEMDDWGEDGPTIGPLSSFQVTYMTHYRIEFVDKEKFDKFKKLTGWEEWTDLTLLMSFKEDMVECGGKYYGDWELITNEEKCRETSPGPGASEKTLLPA